MKKFDHLEAIECLLEIDTSALNPESYYPWYVKPKGAWTLLAMFAILFACFYVIWQQFISLPIAWLMMAMLLISVLLSIVYLFLFKEQMNHAKHKTVQTMMRLEKQEFMKAIEFFVPSDQKTTARRIIHLKDFKPGEYASIVLATKSRLIFNIEDFIRDVERLVAEKPELSIEIQKNKTESDFKISAAAIKHYQQSHSSEHNHTAFNDKLVVPEAVQEAIMDKIRLAALQIQIQKLKRNEP